MVVCDGRGQGTVEYALVTAVFLVVAVAFGALVHALGEGVFAQHIAASASHIVDSGLIQAAGDILYY